MIRRATLQDIETLAILFDEYRIFYQKKSDIQAAMKFLKERLTNEESVIYVSITNDNILSGFVQLYPLFSSTRMKRLWLLNDLYINQRYRGRGYGEALIAEAKELATASKSCGLILETAKGNIIGNRLYIKTNFGLDTEHNFYSWDCNE
jgi:ribosomal protein S18 acetylase RimI-like enzyme